MPRRAKSGITGGQIAAIVAVVALGFAGGFFLLTRSKDPFTGLNELPISSHREDGSRMRGNQFKIKGVIAGRLDDWNTSSEGRVFSIQVRDGNSSYKVAIRVPPELNDKNLIRDQEYQMSVTVGEGGVLVVDSISNT